MVTLEWTEDLAVGVEVIDAGHRRLVTLLTQAEDARKAGDRRASAHCLGLFLREFDKHFAEETALLERHGYGDLARRQSEHLTSQAVMSAHPVEEDDVELIAQLVDYARTWLLDHIVRQDAPLAAFLAAKGLGAQRRGRPWHSLDWFRLRWRIITLGVLPLILVTGLAVVACGELHRTVKSMTLLREMNELNTQIGEAVHELQAERSLAVMAVSNPNLSRDHLKAQIEQSDRALLRFRGSMTLLTPQIVDGSAKDTLQNAKDSLDLLREVRDDVLTGSYDAMQTTDFYNSAIEDLMSLVPDVVRTALPTDFGKDTIAYVFLLEAKERAGRERAIGAAILAGGAPILPFNKANTDIKALADEEESLGKAFELLVPPSVAEAYRMAATVSPALASMRRSLENGDTFGLTAQEWFEASSERIDRIHAFEATVTGDLAFDVGVIEEQARHRADMLTAGMILAIAVSLALTGAVAWTVLPPIRRVSAALRRLGEGSRSLRIPDATARDEIGEIARVVSSLREQLVHADMLDARRWTENAERLRAVADNLPGVVFRVAQPDGGQPVVVAVSRKLRAMTGLSSSEAVDVPLRTLIRRVVCREDRLVLLHVLQRSEGRSVDFEFRLRGDQAGAPRWLRILASPMRNGTGWVWDGVALDVTRLKQAEQHQARASAELERLYRAQTTVQLASSIGSELSALVDPILDSGEDVLRSLPLNSPIREKLRTIVTAAQKMRRLGERINQINPGNDESRSPIDAVAVVEKCLPELRSALPSSASLKTRLAGHGALVRSSPNEIERLVTSLCTYSMATIGGNQGVLSVMTSVVGETEDGEQQLCISIGDSGPGLERHALAKVFAPQFTTRRADRGGEISLAVAGAIVDGCGGWIQGGSKPGSGTFFEVFLPVYRPTTDNVVSLRGAFKWQKSGH